MTSNGQTHLALPTTNDLIRWQQLHDIIVSEINALEVKRVALEDFIRAGSALISTENSLIDRLPPVMPKKETVTQENASIVAAVVQRTKRARHDTWPATIERILESIGHGLGYAEIKVELMKTHLGDTLKRTDKALYTSVAKLEKAHRLVRHNGRLYSPSAFNHFQSDVKAGIVRDEPLPSINHRSAMTEAVKVYLHKHPAGAKSTEIVGNLKENSEFARTINRHKTHIYNILARLVARGEVTKSDGLYKIAVPKPLRNLETNEALSENQSESAPSVASEVVPSLIESRDRFSRQG